MRVELDRDLCQTHGECCVEAPEVFRLDREGRLEVLQPQPPETLRVRVERAVKYCPTRALRLEG
jgi:ferredoxin